MLEPVWIIETLTKSNRKGKKYKAVFYNIDSFNRITTHFGSKNSTTYVSGASDNNRKNYIKRHAPLEKKFWMDKTKWYMPSVLSVRILWGESTDIKKNIRDYKKHYNLII